MLNNILSIYFINTIYIIAFSIFNLAVLILYLVHEGDGHYIHRIEDSVFYRLYSMYASIYFN